MSISCLIVEIIIVIGGDFLNYFPNNDEEKSLLEFISKYQYLNVNDTKYFFSTKKYYKKRISNLVSKKFLRRIKSNLVLGELGIEFVKLFNFEYNALNRNKKYLLRLLYISNLAAFYYNCDFVKFTPSFSMKDKNKYTMTSRKYFGVLEINSIKYLTYCILKEHSQSYINSVIYDIQKEQSFKNVIIFVNDIKRISRNDFTFGINQLLIIEDTEENRENLKYLHSINWYQIVKEQFKGFNICLAEYNFCEYTDYKNRYITTFYFLDTEKINRIIYFLKENKNKNADIICDFHIKEMLMKELPNNCNYCIIDLKRHIEKEHFIYD